MNNLDIYNKAAEVPLHAQKEIKGGKLKGMTDINPMWRIKTLTEIFGPCGIGWYTQIQERWVERDANESIAWVKVALFVKSPETDTWSMPIEGVGGSKQYGKGQGDGVNDEAFKMAETDAISVACKKLGFGAKIYWEKDATKYLSVEDAKPSARKPRAVQAPEQDSGDDEQTSLEKLALADALRDVEEAKTPEELTNAWNRWKSAFGNNVELRKAVATSPANPHKGRSNG
mgnify:CR=1 FL=1